jgi:hypothetical protein
MSVQFENIVEKAKQLLPEPFMGAYDDDFPDGSYFVEFVFENHQFTFACKGGTQFGFDYYYNDDLPDIGSYTPAYTDDFERQEQAFFELIKSKLAL